MSIYEHLEELRKRIMIVVIFFILAMIAGFFLSMPIVDYLQSTPEKMGIELNTFRLSDPLQVFMDFAFVIGLLITLPVALYQLWAFVRPGLYENEQKVTLYYIPVIVFLFLLGLAFSYFVLFPFVIKFMGGLAEALDVEETYGITEYFNFLFQLTLPFGLLFQFPVIVMFLTRLGIITPTLLRKIRKYSYFVILVVAGLITPPELMSHMLVTLPLIILYEISIFISDIAYRKVLKAKIQAETKEN